MLPPPRDPNFIINNPPVNRHPSIVERVSCPICCCYYTKNLAPMIACPSGHTICANCIEGVVKKALDTPENPAACPMCRQRIALPLQLKEEFTEFLKLLDTVGELQFSFTLQSQEIKEKGIRISHLTNELTRRKQEVIELSKKVQTLQIERDRINAENVKLRRENQDLKNGFANRKIFESDSELDTKYEEKQNIKLENRPQIPNKQKDVEIDKRSPLSELYYDGEVFEDRLTLIQKHYTPLQIEFMVFHDLSKLIEINLSCNHINNQGFKMLVENSNFGNLSILRVPNNQITELPSNIEPLSRLEIFNIGNLMGEERKTCNRLRETEMPKLLAVKWDHLRTIDLEFDTDLVWDVEENLDRMVEQWPVIYMINICIMTMRVTKKKCENVKKALNAKAKRPQHQRIQVGLK